MKSPTIGTIHLNVANLDSMVTFYRDIIGLQEHRRENDTIFMGVGAEDLLALHHQPDYPRIAGLTGLYHFAILLPSRPDLGRSLKHLIATRTPLQGTSDHYVSEAVYLADPEGNGIEIYRDKPREDWFLDGEMQLTSTPMDYRGVLDTVQSEDVKFAGLPSGTIIGHIHLHVASVPQAETFYRDVLGMDILFNLGSATFMSYNGYHHHIGANIWAGRNLPIQPVQGLEKYVLHVGDALDNILSKVEAAEVAIQTLDDGYLIRDSSQNAIVLAK
ncbi:MAG: VOC family protein [Anaerolineae bacterium]|nr:VOC family protein [Anaerolineae bacterium]